MDTPRLLEAIDIHADRLKAAALTTGPQAPVPNCPQWTMKDLVAHLNGLFSYVTAMIAGDGADRPASTDGGWPDLLGRWDGGRLAAREALRRPADHPTRSPFPQGTFTVGDWTRRMAHELAIHRLDAEGALPVPPDTRFAPEFAEDGIDEYLAFLLPRRAPTGTQDGVIEVRGGTRTWTLVLRPGERPALGEGSPDVILSGPADDVYRALWGRPHAAATTGDPAVLDLLKTP
ncbi:uncharacterized protein (TIGR03083 family) [Amycolatopsis sulphurea]|uniref:Uncharacterized protein (TIGR03083 family) n=1 Tax=Amycolatopsis sulphurea TaxID=76022 RepID=A0A2A9FBL3_9PSEU|nr:uncharacterized protein (TIGR03083 family) [Amycolatopsis sulphurea]